MNSKNDSPAEELRRQTEELAALAFSYAAARTNVRQIRTATLALIGNIKSELSEQKAIEMIRRAKVVDERWYLNKYPDVAAAEADPVIHYVRYGMAEGRIPSAAYLAD